MDLNVAIWKKASRSNESGDACIELATTVEVIAFRDSKNPDGPKLVISHGEFLNFANVLKKL